MRGEGKKMEWNPKKIGSKIKSLRNEIGLSQAELGEKVFNRGSDSANQGVVKTLESGQRAKITREEISKIIAALGITRAEWDTYGDTSVQAASVPKVLLEVCPELEVYMKMINDADALGDKDLIRTAAQGMIKALDEKIKEL